jgi:hypothetical protein
MQRDSTFGDKVVWRGRPKVTSVPPIYRVGAIFSGVVALITTMSALVVATTVRLPVGGLVLFAAWMATLALGFWQFPKWWRSELEYMITEQNIVVARGKFRRYIDRRAISFARIHWHPSVPNVGDLELVRAVPTGALRRKLTIVLSDIVAPDRVWAFVRGITPAAPAGDGQRLLAQRLDEGERVLWSAHPEHTIRRWMPANLRAIFSLIGGVLMCIVAFTTGTQAVHAVKSVLRAGLDPESIGFVALVGSLTLTVALLGTAAVSIVYFSVVRPARLERETRYLITDRRVLIQRGGEELHLERERIVDVIDAPSQDGRHDLFLVLDGPRALALAPSGAFGEERGTALQPVFKRVDDADAVRRILRSDPEPPVVTS